MTIGPPAGGLYVSAHSRGTTASRALPAGRVYRSGSAQPGDDPWTSYFASSSAQFDPPDAAGRDVPTPNTAGQGVPTPNTAGPDLAAPSAAGGDLVLPPMAGTGVVAPSAAWRNSGCYCAEPDDDPFTELAAEVAAQAAAALTTLLVHVPSPRHPAGTPFSAPVAELLRESRATLARDDEPVHAGLLLIRFPHLFGADPVKPAHVTADRTVVVIDRPADPAAVHRRFGPDAVLAPTCPEVRTFLLRLAPAARLTADNWHGPGDCSSTPVSRLTHFTRLTKLGVRPPGTRRDPATSHPRTGRRFLFVGLSDDGGLGAGHLTRLMAIGHRLPSDVQAVLATRSESAALACQEGFLTEYLPSAEALAATPACWTRFLRDRLAHLIAVHEPGLVAVDGLPDRGVAAAVRDHPEITWIWLRRALWRPDAAREWIAAGAMFDAILEPGEFAGVADTGPTATDRDRTHETAPITLLDEHQLLCAADARRSLGLTVGRPAALIRSTGDRDRIARHLVARGFQVVLAEPALAPALAVPSPRPALGSPLGRALTLASPRPRIPALTGAPSGPSSVRRSAAEAAAPGTVAPLLAPLAWSARKPAAGHHAPPVEPVGGLPGAVTARLHPVSRYLKAFDLVVCAPGYDEFHEAIAFRVPAVFVPGPAAPLDDQALKFLGRAHDVNEGQAALATAQSVFPRVSFDLIYALPGQRLADWRAELARALSFGTEHLSLYQLTIEPGTRFATEALAGRIVIPDGDSAADLFEATRADTAAAGLPAYETSNHARPGSESRHNLAYWRYQDYAGIGPGAHGRRGGLATVRRKKPENWLTAIERNGHGMEVEDPLTPSTRATEALLMGLRLAEGSISTGSRGSMAARCRSISPRWRGSKRSG